MSVWTDHAFFNFGSTAFVEPKAVEPKLSISSYTPIARPPTCLRGETFIFTNHRDS